MTVNFLPNAKTVSGYTVSFLTEIREPGKPSYFYGIVGLGDPRVGGWPEKWAEDGKCLGHLLNGPGFHNQDLVFERADHG